ncbi:MAG: regulatory iron-sulfur-containing complex subunit RicT [bacterium]
MLKVLEIRFTPWGKVYYFDGSLADYRAGEHVIVNTEVGVELGQVVGLKAIKEEAMAELGELKKILRRANPDDLAKSKKDQGQKNEVLAYCQQVVGRMVLPMKLVDAHFSFDGGRITFAFTSESRIDFRDLVRDLTRHFQKSIRLHQLGIRDEARIMGELGPCGRRLCCAGFLRNLTSVTSDAAECQQVAHRGSERLSGVCGRLMCCLNYEKKMYEELGKKLPALASEVKTAKGIGHVCVRHILKQSVEVELKDGTRVEVPKE